MTNKEINIRSVLFLVIGILLVLSLVICIYIVNGEKDLVKTEATVLSVDKDSDGNGKNKVVVVYEVNGQSYEYEFFYKDAIKENDKLSIYYHENSYTTVQTFRTSKIIFVCPLIGLILCVFGIYELFKGNNDVPVEQKTQALGVSGETKKISIVTSEETKKVESKEKVEKKEEPVEVAVEVPPVTLPLEEEIEVKKEQPKKEVVTEVKNVAESSLPAEKNIENVIKNVDEVKKEVSEYKVETKNNDTPSENNTMKSLEEAVKVEPAKENMKPLDDIASLKENKDNGMKSIEDMADKVQASLASSIAKDKTDDEIKDVIKAMLKEAIKEVNEEKEPAKPVVQKRVIPHYFYISGTSLIYEEAGKKAEELNLKDIKSVVRTINSVGNVVKVVVSNDQVKCVLTNMKNIDLEQLANLLHNKMRTIDDSFKEIIERKEY